MKFTFRGIALAAALTSAAAGAQTYVATTVDGVPFPALTAATPITFVAAAGTADDRGRAQIPLPFTFPFYDRTYTQVTVTANGLLFFEPSSAINLGSDFPSNILGSVAEPNGIVAPFWDDLIGNNPSSVAQTQSVTGANGTGLAIEFKDWNRIFGTYLLNFQVRLWSNGVIETYYGTMTGTGSTVSASCGIEAPGTGLPVMCPCASNNNCVLADLPIGRRVTFGPAAGADLLARSLRVDSIVPSGPNLQITTTLALRNFGTVPASNFTYRLYASDDTFYSAGTDTELLPGPQGPLSLNPLTELTDQVTTTVPIPAGPFYVLAVIDDGNVVVETNEFNNLAATPTPFSPGVDLVAQQIRGPPLGGPGEPITNTIVFSNQGVSGAGNVGVKIWLSQDTVLGLGDLNVYTGVIPVAGGQNISTDITYPLPSNVPAGTYTFILQLDDGPAAGAIAETSDLNNIAIGTTPFTARQADLVVDAVSVQQPLTPFLPATQAYFGEPIRVHITIRNQGGATAPQVSVLAFLSDNDTLNAITDTFVGEVTGLSLPPGQSLGVDITQVVPLLGSAGQQLLTGQYFFFGAVVGVGLVEVSGNNNFLKAPPMKVRDPAPDLVPLLVSAPALVGQGERVIVTRTLANLGNRPSTQASYRYYLSANPIITTDDTAVPLVAPNGSDVDVGQVTLGLGERSVVTEVLHIPPGVGLSTWYLGVLLDPNNAIDETDETNNGFASQQVTVIASGLAVSTSVLPDGVLDVGYEATLGATGGDHVYTWDTRPGSSLPAGLTLTAGGRLSGTPTVAGAFAIDVLVHSNGLQAEKVLVLRVSPPTATFDVATVSLPPVPRLLPYVAYLSAVGGHAPYQWAVASGQLPVGLSLDPSGRVTGTASGAVDTMASVRFRAGDAVGNVAERTFSMRVIDSTNLRIGASELPPALVGDEYTDDLLAFLRGSMNMPPVMPQWSVAGELPPGLGLDRTGDAHLLISGTPTEVGVFQFAIEVHDASGQSDVHEFVLAVLPRDLHLNVDLPAAVAPGDKISATVESSTELPNAVFRLRDGMLPQGLTVSPDGAISGTLPTDLREGIYVFTVAYTQGLTDVAFRTVAVNVNVVAARKLKGCGCGAAGGSDVFALLLCLSGWAGSRKRRTPHVGHASKSLVS